MALRDGIQVPSTSISTSTAGILSEIIYIALRDGIQVPSNSISTSTPGTG